MAGRQKASPGLSLTLICNQAGAEGPQKGFQVARGVYFR